MTPIPRLDQVEHFIADVTASAGNRCEVVEYDVAEFEALLSRDDRLARDLRADGVALTSRRLPRRVAAAPQPRRPLSPA
jgi:hypothetical protein